MTDERPGDYRFAWLGPQEDDLMHVVKLVSKSRTLCGAYMDGGYVTPDDHRAFEPCFECLVELRLLGLTGVERLGVCTIGPIPQYTQDPRWDWLP